MHAAAENAGFSLTHHILWTGCRAQWAPFLLTNAADLSEALQEAQTLIPAFAVSWHVTFCGMRTVA